MIHLKWIKSRKVRNIKNSLPLIISKVDITYITSHNVYYVNSKVGEVMEKSDLIKLESAIEVVEDYILNADNDYDSEFYDVLLLSLKVAYYDMMKCV